MDSITLENFISFCDDMQIAQEGFKDTKIYTILKKGWTIIKEAINKLLLKIRAFLTKFKSKGDDVLVSEEFLNKFLNLDSDIQKASDLSTNSSVFTEKIEDLLNTSIRTSQNLKTGKLSIRRLSASISNLSNLLKNMQQEADEALEEIEKRSNFHKANMNAQSRNPKGNFRMHNNTLERNSNYKDAQHKLKIAQDRIAKIKLLMRLYIGVLNKVLPSPNNNN